MMLARFGILVVVLSIAMSIVGGTYYLILESGCGLGLRWMLP